MNFIKKLKTYYSKNEDFARTICFKNQIIEVFESFRQSIEIKVEDAKLTIRCPYRISDLKLQSFLDKKKSWINKKLKIQLKNRYLLDKRRRRNIYFYLGTKKKLKLELANSLSISLSKTNIIYKDNSLSDNKIRKNLINWFKLSAYNFLLARIKKISSRVEITFNNAFIKEYKSKWGLCYYEKKNICLNWKLIMAPVSVIDYVIIHELCHLVEPNHSSSFWKEIYKIKKDYKNDILWLKKNGALLSI